jgi:hypothetical protein
MYKKVNLWLMVCKTYSEYNDLSKPKKGLAKKDKVVNKSEKGNKSVSIFVCRARQKPRRQRQASGQKARPLLLPRPKPNHN